MKAIVGQIILTSFTSKVDGSLSFRGTTPELSTVEKVALMDLQGKNVRALFEPMDYSTDGKVEIKNPLSGKSPGERLRGVLFVFFKQNKIIGTYDEFYVKQMETIIQSYKDQLEPE
jgi:hypothetical protein